MLGIYLNNFAVRVKFLANFGPFNHQVCLKLKGIAVESESISKFVDSIQRSGVFPKVELHSMQERMLLDRSIQDFELECFGNE